MTVDIRDYGAVGDGTTDDSTAIQQAADRAWGAGGGTVYLPGGNFRGNVTLRKWVHLVGESHRLTRLSPYDTSRPVLSAPQGDYLTSWSLRNLTINGRKAAGATAPCLLLNMPAGYYSSGFIVEAVHFEDWHVGIKIAGLGVLDPLLSFVQFGAFRNVTFNDTPGASVALHIQGCLLDSSFDTCHFRTEGVLPVKIEPHPDGGPVNTAARVGFRNCAFVRSASTTGVALNLSGGRNLEFSNCYFEGAQNSIHAHKAAHADELSVTFHNCRFWNYTAKGVNLLRADAAAFTGTCRFRPLAPSAYAAIDMSGAASVADVGPVTVDPTVTVENHASAVRYRGLRPLPVVDGTGDLTGERLFGVPGGATITALSGAVEHAPYTLVAAGGGGGILKDATFLLPAGWRPVEAGESLTLILHGATWYEVARA